MNTNIFYLNRIIKIISPLTFQTFKIELNGEEEELRDLLATIIEIDPNSIKGLRDSYNNYYTLSSAIKNPHLNTSPYNYYTVVIKELNNSNNSKNQSQIRAPSYNYNILKNERIYTLPNEKNINYHTNFLNNTYNFYEDNNNYNGGNINLNNYWCNNIGNKYDINEYLSFADDLYKKNYIDKDLVNKLKRLILENNKEVLSIMSPYINIKSQRSYDEFAKKIIPIISYRSQNSENLEESRYSTISFEKEKKSSKKSNILQNDKILDDIKHNMNKKEYDKLKKLLKSKSENLTKIINNFEKNKDSKKLISKLKKLVKEESNDNSEISKKNKKKKSELTEKEIKKIDKNIINALKDKGIDIYYISKYDLQKLSNEEKISLYKKKFNLKLDILKDKDYKIPKNNIPIIQNYYAEYINKKIKKNFDEKENIIYEGLLEQEEEENNFILKYYKELLKHKNINELKNQIKQVIKDTVERIQEEEGEEEEEEDEEEEGSKKVDKNQEKASIKEENEEEEEEENDEEGEEEEDEKESKNDENKSSSNKSSDNIIILKDDNKDRGVNLLNNNYRKINNYNYNSNKINEKNINNENKEENAEKKNEEQNLGLGFVVIKPKKPTNGEDNNILKLNNSESKQNESTSTNPNKKLNQFIQQIEHLKKIDDIKSTIIEAINNNNKYIMDLFQKFQKNKFCLNPKSLVAVYKLIKENPESINQSKDNKNNRSIQGNEFKSLISEIPNINENTQAFLFNEFINKNNSELEAHFSIYEENKEKDEFIESIEMFLNKSNTKALLSKFNMNHIKKEIEPKLSIKNENFIEKSMDIIKIFEKYNLFSEKEIIMCYNFKI